MRSSSEVKPWPGIMKVEQGAHFGRLVGRETHGLPGQPGKNVNKEWSLVGGRRQIVQEEPAGSRKDNSAECLVVSALPPDNICRTQDAREPSQVDNDSRQTQSGCDLEIAGFLPDSGSTGTITDLTHTCQTVS